MVWVPAATSVTSLQSNDTGQPFSTGAPVVSVDHSPMSTKRSSPSTPSMPAKRSAILRGSGARVLTQEEAALADRFVGARRLVDAHQDLRRLGRDRADGRRRQPAAQVAGAGGGQGGGRRGGARC